MARKAADNLKLDVRLQLFKKGIPDMGTLQSDIEKILFSKQFRRFEDKTQLFPTVDGDHFRNRLTHTLEVLAIGKRIAKEFNEIIEARNASPGIVEKFSYVNEDLVEAIALCHDVGHTPFGHVGERTINEIVSHKDTLGGLISEANEFNYQVFKHNIYSGYVLLKDFQGIDDKVVDGAIKHTKVYVDINRDNDLKNIVKKGSNLDSKKFYSQILTPYTIEGQIVAASDEIAQRCADFDDTFRSRYVNNIKAQVGIDDLDVRERDIKDGTNVYERLVVSIKEHLIYGLKKSFDNIIAAKHYDFSNLTSSIVNYYGKEVVSYPYLSDEFKSQRRELSEQSRKDAQNYEFLKNKEKMIFQSLQNGEKLDYTASLEPCFTECEFNSFSERFEIIRTKRLDDKLNDLARVITREYRIRSFDSSSKYIIRQIFKALYNDIGQMENNQILKMIADYESFLNKGNINKIVEEICERVDLDAELKNKLYSPLENKLDSSKDFEEELRKYLKNFNANFYNSVSLLKKKNDEKNINLSELYVFINFVKAVDSCCIGQMTQKLHNILLKHVAYYIANMTDGYARKIYGNLYGILGY